LSEWTSWPPKASKLRKRFKSIPEASYSIYADNIIADNKAVVW